MWLSAVGVEHKRLRGHEGRHIGIDPRRRIDKGSAGTVTRCHTDTGTLALATLCVRIISLLYVFFFFPASWVMGVE